MVAFHRARASFLIAVTALLFPVLASAAAVEFRILLDIDNNGATGCTTHGMAGVDQIVALNILSTDTSAQVASSSRQVCSGGSFAAPVDVVLTPRPIFFQADSGAIMAEHRIAFAALNPSGDMPRGMRWGFSATDGAFTQTVLAHPNGDPIIYPPTGGPRRRAVGNGAPPPGMAVDTSGAEWSRTPPLVQGIAGSGSPNLRLLKMYAFAHSVDRFLYFRLDAFIRSDAPFANDDTYARFPGEGLSVVAPGVLANDGDPAGQPLTALPVSVPANGNVTLNPDGSFTYTPNDPGNSSADSFEYKANNGEKDSNVARVTINVSTSPNAAPTAVDDSYNTGEDAPLNVAAPGVLANDTDPDGDALNATLLDAPDHGNVVLNANGSFTYTPNANFFGVDSFTYAASDGELTATATVTITIASVDEAPVANNVSATTNEDQPVAVTLSATDEEGASLTYNVGSPSNGALSGTAPNLTYTPNANFFGTDSFTYTVSDGTNTSNTATVQITVNPVNDEPSFACGPNVISDSSAGAASFPGWATGISAGPANESSQTPTFEITANSNPGLFSVQPSVSSSGTLAFTPVAGANGTANITVHLRDDGGIANGGDDTSVSCSFTITLDAPPSVSSTTPANGATDLATSTNIVVNFSENVTLSAGWLSITCGATTITDANGVVTGGPASYTFNPTADLPAGSTCNATVFAAQVADNDTNDPPNNMAANHSFSFATDAAPAVSSTTPANGATGVATNANVVVNFNESVNAAGASFTISCASSGSHTFTTSASPSASFTLDPNTDFTQGETCTVTVLAAGVTDQDANDPPNNMVADHVFSFTADAAPSVTAVTPANASTNIATNTNLTVTFSEPVTITNGSVTINCANTGAHTVAVSGGPTTWTVNPNVDFGNGELCTATVLMGGVADNDANDPPDGLLADFVWSFTTDNPPSVTATTPANGSISFPATDITVTFSEAVNATASSFTIACGTSGAHAFALSGGPTTFTLNPTDFTGGETCTVTVVAANVTDADAGDPPDNMTVDHVFTFNVDAAPSVTSTTPANAAPQVAADTNVTVNFSESVNASGASFTISCATSGPHTFTTSASPNTTFTLNPDADFTQGELCTVTVLAAGVTDVDAFDPPNNMAADHVFTFTIDAAPAVSSTTPANAATDIGAASNITINFSEGVNAAGSSFTISCGTSGPHTFALSGGPTAWTLNPDADFTQGETCTVTVVAANVTDTDTVDPPQNMLTDYLFTFTIDVAPTVTAVTPTNSSTNIATNTNLTVTFSEPVTITNGSVTINCANTGAHTVAVSGGPTTWTVNPNVDFGNGEVCTATVLMGGVADNDANDPPDGLLADFVWSFTTDNPPSVTATTPANASTSFPATDITVTFSEAVNATASSFTIACGTSGAHAFALSGGPTTFTLNPTTDFTGGETCTVTVVAANVTDADAGDPPDNMTVDHVFSFNVDAAPAVSSTTPANGALQVAANADVNIDFSEIVNYTGASFTINCASSGSHTFTSSAGPAATATLNPDTNFTQGELCTVTVLAAGVTDADAFDPPDNMAADYVFTFNVDAAPTVSSTTPADVANDVGGATNITINFSEGVNAGASSFTISCTSSGPHTFALSGGPTSWTLNPDADFTQAETCTVTVVAANVTDADSVDPPDNMLTDYVFSFTIDTAPTVTAVTPANASTNVATNTNLTATFSEPVTITNGSVTINCANTGAHTVAVSGGPTTWTINPTSDFGNGELCTATVLMGGVADNDANDPPDGLLADFVWSFTTDNPPSVSSTAPANGGGAAPSADVSVTFDEAVNAPASAFTISCTTSGSHSFTLSGGPTTFTLDPGTDFTGGETCTVTVVAANVSDADAGDPPDNMVTDHVFSFSVDAAPAVQSTSPADNAQAASNTNVVINFSESVNASGTSFTISCALSGLHTFTTSGSPSASFTLDPVIDFTLGETCTVTVLAAGVTDTDAIDPPDNMAGDYVFDFTVDAAPAVQSTTPAGSATGVTTTANIDIVFSEAVTFAGGSFTISCTVSGAHTFALSGTSTSATLNPDTDFTAGETCTVTVLAAGVTDNDANDPPNNMLADYPFSFTIDAAPFVSSTTPIDLATQQANNTDITITFNEAVNATTSSFTVSCGSSGGHAFALSGGPTTWTLNPDTDFTNGETCTVTVVAANVADTDTNDPPDNMAADHVFTFEVDNVPSVSSTTPTEGSMTVSPSSTITINFSESVNATTSSFTINCGGNQPYTLSASPATSFTLTPNANLPTTACTVTVIAAQITDADAGDPPDTMVTDFTLNFTVNTPPTANDDVDNALGNLTLTVGDADGVLVNGTDGSGADVDPDPGSSLSIAPANQGPLTGSAGGTLTFTSGGGFTYHSEAGDQNVTDVFTYTVTDNNGATDTGTLTINVGPRYIFVDDSGTPPGDGRDISPYTTLQAAEAGSAANDTFVIKQGTYQTANDFIILKNGQTMYGDGAFNNLTTTFNSESFTILVPSGTHPMIRRGAAGNTITLAQNNTLRGIDVAAVSGGTAIFGLNFGTLTLDQNGRIGETGNTNNGTALNLENGTIAGVGWGCMHSVSSTGFGVRLVGLAGSLTTVCGSIQNAASGNLVSGGNGTISINGSVSHNAAASRIIEITGRTGGTVTFSGFLSTTGGGLYVHDNTSGTMNFSNNNVGSKVFNTGANTAIELLNNGTAAINFTNGHLDIDTTTGIGFTATGGGTLTIGGTDNTIATTSTAANALILNGVTLSGTATFQSINSTGATTAVSLTSIGNGNVTINGGTISGGTTGVALNTLGTSNVTLSGVTLTGVTTAINGSNFGTLTGAGTTNVSGVTALSLNSGTVSGTFNNVSSTGGTNGVSLTGVAGTWTVTAGTLTGASGATFNVSGGSANITWGPSITQSNAANVVTIAGGNSGIINFNGNVTSNTTSTGLSISGSSGTYNFNATNAFTGAGGITIGPAESGAVSFSASTTNTTAGTAFNVSGGGGVANAVSAAITYSGTINKTSGGILINVDNLTGTLNMTKGGTPAAGDLTQSSNGAQGIIIINSSGTITISNASVTFQNSNPGVTASGNSGTINLPGLALTGSGNKAGMLISGGGTINVNAGAANPSINVSTGSSNAINGTTVAYTGTLNLTNVTMSGNATVDTVTLTGSTLGGTGSTITGSNRALVLSAVTLTNGAGMASVTSTGGTNGISLTNVSGGTYTIAAGALSGHAGTTFNVSTGSATFTYGGTVSQINSQRVVNVDGTTGGTISFTNTVTGGASSTGVNINNANGNVSFTTLNLGTSGSRIGNQAVTITNGTGAYSLGAVSIFANNVSGIVAMGANGALNSTSGTVDTGTATAINIDGPAGLTTLGMTLTNVTSSGGTSNGITIQDANGSFTVNGDGSNTTTGGNSSGGTISGKSGANGVTTAGNGVYLNNVTNITLRRMTINGTNQNHGIRGVTVNGFTLEYSTVSGTNGTDAATDEGSINFDNLTGAASIKNCVVEGGFEDNLNVVNTSGSLNRLVIESSTFGFNSTSNGNNNILLESQNPGTSLNYTIKGCLIKGARADWLNAQPAAGGSMDGIIGGDLVADGNTFDNRAPNNHPGVVANGNRILLQANGSYTVTVKNNTIRGSLGSAVATNSLNPAASMNIRIEKNTIGVAATGNSGSTSGSGISIQSTSSGDVNVLIDDNDVFQYNNHGILLTFGDVDVSGPPTITATVSNNTVNTPGSLLSNFNGFHLNNGIVAGETFTTCLNIFNNDFTSSGSGAVSPNNDDIRLRQRQNTTVQLPGYTGPARDNVDFVVSEVTTYLRPAGSGGVKNNIFGTGTANSVTTGGGFTNSPGGAACATP